MVAFLPNSLNHQELLLKAEHENDLKEKEEGTKGSMYKALARVEKNPFVPSCIALAHGRLLWVSYHFISAS